MCEFDKLNKTFSSDLYLIYKRSPSARVCISEKDRLLMFYLSLKRHLFTNSRLNLSVLTLGSMNSCPRSLRALPLLGGSKSYKVCSVLLIILLKRLLSLFKITCDIVMFFGQFGVYPNRRARLKMRSIRSKYLPRRAEPQTSSP